MIDLPGVSAVQVVVERLGGMRSWLFQRGDPARIAGDPEGIRRLAEHHRTSAGRVGAMTARVRDDVFHVLAGSWQGDASVRFSGYWSDLERRLDALAAAHQGMAAGLEQVADDSARLNREMTALLEETEGWLSRATAALAAPDVGAAGWLAGDGMTLVVRWESLLRDVETFADAIERRLQGRLDFARRLVAMGHRLPQPQPPIDLPPPLPSRALVGRLSAQGSPMADRHRVGPGGRRYPLPPPHPGGRRRVDPPWALPSPERRRPRVPGQRRRPRLPPSEPQLPGRTGIDSQPRKEPRTRQPGRAGAPLTIPTTGAPSHAPPVHIHDSSIAAPLTVVDALLLQLGVAVALTGHEARKLIGRIRRGKNVGDTGVTRVGRR